MKEVAQQKKTEPENTFPLGWAMLTGSQYKKQRVADICLHFS